jgi:uridine kinase
MNDTRAATAEPRSELGTLRLLARLEPAELEALGAYLERVETARGETVIVESAPSDRLIFVVDGELSIEHREVPSGALRAGDHFGVELVLGGQRNAFSVRTRGICVLLELRAARFEALREERPTLAFELLRALLADTLAPQRPKQAPTPASVTVPPRHSDEVTVHVAGEPRRVSIGTSYAQLLPRGEGQSRVVAALVDEKATSLEARVSAAVRVRALTLAHWEGQRVYRQSLALLALEAARRLAPEVTIKVGPSVGFGCRLLTPGLVGPELAHFAEQLQRETQELRRRGVRLRSELWTVDEARRYFERCGFRDAEQLLHTWQEPAVPVVTYGEVFALDTSPLVADMTDLPPFQIVADDDVLMLVYGRRSDAPEHPTRSMPVRALTDVGEAPPAALKASTFSQLRSAARFNQDVSVEEQVWFEALGVKSVGAFNQVCVRGNLPQLIRIAEGFQEKRLTNIADAVQRARSQIDAICIAGPSSSGKSTFIRRLCVQLQVNGINPVALGLDDYYVDRERTPRDETGDFDFEAFEAIDTERLNDHLARLFAGETVKTARYQFAAGRSDPSGGPVISLGERDVLVLEGIHGLNPRLLSKIPPERVFRVFICPLGQLAFDHLSRVHASDVRLVRRIVRDRHARGFSAADTIARWPKVRAAERKHIFPFQTNADAVFDTSLLYELSVLRVYAERYLLEVPRDNPAYSTAFRLLHELSRFICIYPDHVPPTSILREFIGGSGFEY